MDSCTNENVVFPRIKDFGIDFPVRILMRRVGLPSPRYSPRRSGLWKQMANAILTDFEHRIS